VTGAVECTALVCLLGALAKLNIASEIPAVHNKTPTKLRELTKPEFEEGFFFMAEFLLRDG